MTSEGARLLLSQNRRALFNDIIGREREKHSCLGHNGFSFASGLASPSLRASIPIHARLLVRRISVGKSTSIASQQLRAFK